MKKRAIITGITGQDGSYLCEFLLEKGYEVHGIRRRASQFNTERIDHLYKNQKYKDVNLFIHYGDLADTGNITKLIEQIQPDEIYNLGAQSHVAVSFEIPEYTAEIDAIGPLRILEAIKILGLNSKTKFYQASSSEMYGLVQESPQSEFTKFYPRSPYAVSKLFGYWITINYREAYGIFACNGILFNHESKRRGETFVTRKITRGLANIAQGLEKCLFMGNLNSLRDWGHAKDYVRMQWMMLQQETPSDYVIATGKQYSVREFFQRAAKKIGLEIKFIGDGINEKAIVTAINGTNTPEVKIGQEILKIDPRYYRKTEVESLLGNPTKAIKNLGWIPEITLDDMIDEMIENDLEIAKKNKHLKNHGFI